MLYVANVGEDELSGNPLAQKLMDYGAQEGAEVVVLSAKIEAEVAQLHEQERKEFLAALGLKESGLDRLVHAGQKLLKLMTFFTAGPEESHAWNISEGLPALKAAGKSIRTSNAASSARKFTPSTTLSNIKPRRR